MKIFGSISELVSAIFRKNSQQITVRPNQATTYTAARDIQLPPGDADHVIVSASSTQTLTNKTFDADGTGNSITNIENADIKSGAAIDATKIATGSVDNTEFGYLNGVTSAIQTQLDGKVTGPASASNNSIATFDGTTGKLVQNTGVAITGGNTFVGATIDGDTNTIQDLPVTAIKTVLADADKVLRRDASGVPQSGNSIPNSDPIVTTTATQTLTNKTLTSPSISTPTGLVANDVGLGNVDNTSDATKNAATATLTNKTIQEAIIDNFIDFNEESAPATPSSGRVRVYAKSDNKLYQKDDNGVETLVGGSSGSGSGEINAILNPSAATDTSGWAAATNYTVARDTSNSPLSPVVSTSLAMSTSAASSESSTSGVYYVFTLPTGLENKKEKLEFYCTVPATADGVWRVSVYDGTTRLALSTDSSGATTLPGGFTGKFTTYVDTTANNTYTVSFTQTTRTNANTLYVTQNIFGPGTQPQGAIISDWEAFTPTCSWVTNTTSTARYRRVGSDIEIYFALTLTGAPNLVDLEFDLPSGLTVNTSVIQNYSSAADVFGFGFIRRSGVNTYVLRARPKAGADLNTFQFDAYSESANISVTTGLTATNPVSFGNGDSFVCYVKAPISEWTNSGTLNISQNDVEYASNSSTGVTTDTTSFAYGPDGGQLPSGTAAGVFTKRVSFQTPIQPTDSLILEIRDGADKSWVPIWSRDPGGNTQDFDNQNGATYGMAIRSSTTSGNVVDVTFGQYAITSSTYGAAGFNWGGTTNQRWRVRKVKGGTAVGFGAATADSLGLVRAAAGTFTATFTQAGGYSQAVTVAYQRVGNAVTLRIPAFQATATATASIAASAALPSAITPTVETYQVCSAISNGTNAAGLFRAETNGTLRLFATVGLGSFSTGTCGLSPGSQTFCYTMN